MVRGNNTGKHQPVEEEDFHEQVKTFRAREIMRDAEIDNTAGYDETLEELGVRRL